MQALLRCKVNLLTMAGGLRHTPISNAYLSLDHGSWSLSFVHVPTRTLFFFTTNADAEPRLIVPHTVQADATLSSELHEPSIMVPPPLKRATLLDQFLSLPSSADITHIYYILPLDRDTSTAKETSSCKSAELQKTDREIARR